MVCDADFNRVKIKLESYVNLHQLRSTLSPKNMLRLVMANEGSEFLAYFPEYREDYDELADKFTLLGEATTDVYKRYKDIENQKEFALSIKNHPLSAAMFSVRAGKADNIEEWLRGQCPKKVLELIQRVYGVETKTYG